MWGRVRGINYNIEYQTMEFNVKDTGGKTVLTLNISGKEDSEGWLQGTVVFELYGFHANFGMSIMLNDFYPFIEQLKNLNKSLKGSASFKNIEDNIDLFFEGDGIGHIKTKGILKHSTNPFLSTSFEIDTDQTFLPEMISQLETILEYFKR